MHVARARLQENFGRAAAEYDARAQFQHVQTRRVFDAAWMLFPENARVLDIGCGTGYFATIAKEKRPHWQVLGLDVANGMCVVAKSRCGVVNASAERIPLAECSVDSAVSSLCYQWVEDTQAAFAELARVLRPGGRAVVATLGAQTLCELRACAQAVALPLQLLPMRGFEDTQAALRNAGLGITFAEARLVTEYYPDVTALLDSMRAIGAGNNFAGQGRGFLAPKRWAALLAAYAQKRTPEGLPATWEHHFFVLHKPL